MSASSKLEDKATCIDTMPPGRVIFDSDEDDDEDGASLSELVPPQDIPITGTFTLDVNGSTCNPAETQKSAEASTGSTGVLTIYNEHLPTIIEQQLIHAM